ncbi:MAG TPA: hypothetical protein VHR86_08625 [Armatimonadota bacterium]|nr:hypothetical protein [Armatimonadota bacterium]
MPVVSERDRLLLMLASVPGLGERTLGRLLDSGFPLARLFELPITELQGRFGLTRRAAEVVSGGAERLSLRAAPQVRLLEDYGIRLLVSGAPA